MQRLAVLGVVMLALLWGTEVRPEEHAQGAVYRRVNLVSDIAGVARFTDPNLVNPWGLAFSATSPSTTRAWGRCTRAWPSPALLLTIFCMPPISPRAWWKCTTRTIP